MYLISFFLGCCCLVLVASTSKSKSDVNNLMTSSVDGVKYLSEEDKCIANIRQLIPDRKISRNLGGIVGMGYDALTNKVTLPVFPQTFKSCQTVPDGDFLIPDGVVAIPVKEANLHKSSQTFEKFSDYKNSFSGSLSVSMGGGVPGIASVSGSMSVETKIGKEHMEKHKQTAFTNTIEYRAFTLIGTEEAGFDELFEDRLNDIVNATRDGNLLLAQYHAETIIADYGTHVTNKALAGASVTMLSFAETSNITQKDSFALKVSTEFHSSFLGAVDMGMKASVENQNSNQNSESSSSSQSYIITKGGPDVNRLLSYNADKMQIDSVVGLNHEVMPLYSYIHPKVMKGKNWDDTTTLIVQDYLLNATREYIRYNTIPGCTDSSEDLYFHMANVDDFNACQLPGGYNFGYGGYYQDCEYIESSSKAHPKLKHGNQCDQYKRINPLKNNYTCVHDAPQLNYPISFYVTFKHRVHNAKTDGCNATDCFTNYTITDRIKVTAYICEDFGGRKMLFGGIFQNENIFSNNKRCAYGYEEYPILHNHIICLAALADFNRIPAFYEQTYLAFGGFKGCGDESKCKKGYARYYLTSINNCPYYYCAGVSPDAISFKQSVALSSPIKPPYVDRDLAFTKTRLHYQHEIEKIEEEAAEKMLTEDGEVIGEIVN